MLREYFNTTIETTYLKALLSAVQLPKFKIVKDGDLIFKDYFYIYKDMVIHCLETGNIEKNSEIYEVLEHYYFCDMDQNIEFKEFIRASYYSTELHKRLGQYLRCLRDLYGVDLMGMYNCFSYELFSDLYIDYDDREGWKKNRIFIGKNPDKKILAIPIKFNQKYTIAVTSKEPVYVSPVLKLPNGLRSLQQLNLPNYTENTMGVRLLNSAQFDLPQEFSLDLTEDQGDYYKYERYLYLIVQLSSSNESSFVVLEGEYEDYNTAKIVGLADYTEPQDEQTPLIFRPKLLEMNDGTSYAYSNVLMQYLLNNVITNRDFIGDNITYAKKLLGFSDDVNYWNNNIKYSAFMKYLYRQNKKIPDDYTEQNISKMYRDCNDVTGFIDKQIEEWLNANNI